METKRMKAAMPGHHSNKGIIRKDFIKNRYIYLLALPVIAWYFIFNYMPMYGTIIAFKDFSPGRGIWGSPWYGLNNFTHFFQSVYAWRVIRNTLLINLYSLVLGFPAPILLALMFNELSNVAFKRTIQTIGYLPHFVSIMVVCGMIVDFTTRDGLLSTIMQFFGGKPLNMLTEPMYFRGLYVGSGIWQEIGWSSIIYLAAISGIDSQQYEAALMDGAGRFRRLWHITLPGIMGTIVILLILRMGQMMSIGYEKVILLYNPATYETGDVISSFVYRKGLQNGEYGFATAVGLLNSIINLMLLASTNWISARLGSTSLW
jgi:putative aldouronate transport system permease protein